MQTLSKAYYHSPIGIIEITATTESIISVLFTAENNLPEMESHPPCLTRCVQQLSEYFAGNRQEFDLPIYSSGTLFQEQVWQRLHQIGFGKTLSYSDLSNQLGNLGAIRAVGSANGRNKLLLIRPCHRVIGADGKLVGYAGELWRKRWLLDHERKIAGTPQLSLFV